MSEFFWFISDANFSIASLQIKRLGDQAGLLFKCFPFNANESLLPGTGGRSLDILQAPLCLFSKANSQPLSSERIVSLIRIALDGHVLLPLPPFLSIWFPFYFHLSSPFPRFRPACHAIAISSRKSKCLSLPQGRGLFLRLSRFSALSKTPAWTFPAGPRMQPSAGRGCWG